MSRDNDQVVLMRGRWDATDYATDTHIECVTFERPVKVQAVKIIPYVALDTDGDTLAVDVSYSTDGFSASDVEIAAHAAEEFNTTDNTVGTLKTAVDVPLTAATVDSMGEVRVPADAVIQLTITATGSSATGNVDVVVLGKVI